MNKNIKEIREKKYISVITFRKNGEAVPSPVWFVENDNKLYIATGEGTYKVKRLKNNLKVQIAPCSQSGKPYGEYFNATARFLDIEEFDAVLKLLRGKYRLFRLWNAYANMRKKKGKNNIFIEFSPEN